MDFDRILEKVGPCGRYQIYHYILLGLVLMPCGMQNMANVFLAGLPAHVCDVTPLPVDTAKAFMADIDPSASTNDDSSCRVFDMNYTELYWNSSWKDNSTMTVYVSNKTDVVDCHGWRYDKDLYGSTIVSQVGEQGGSSVTLQTF